VVVTVTELHMTIRTASQKTFSLPKMGSPSVGTHGIQANKVLLHFVHFTALLNVFQMVRIFYLYAT